MADDTEEGAPTGAPNTIAPSRGRIRPGERRNPWGRSGRPKPPAPDFLDELIEIRIEGRPQRVTRETALNHFMFMEASKGTVSAALFLSRSAARRRAEAAASPEAELSPEEQEAFERFIRRQAARISGDGSTGEGIS